MKALLFCSLAVMCLSVPVQAATPDGKSLYQDNCAGCHGDKGQGGLGLKLVGDATTWSEELFERAVLQGLDEDGQPLKLSMPHWQDGSFKDDHGETPSSAEVAAIYQYLRSLE